MIVSCAHLGFLSNYDLNKRKDDIPNTDLSIQRSLMLVVNRGALSQERADCVASAAPSGRSRNNSIPFSTKQHCKNAFRLILFYFIKTKISTVSVLINNSSHVPLKKDRLYLQEHFRRVSDKNDWSRASLRQSGVFSHSLSRLKASWGTEPALGSVCVCVGGDFAQSCWRRETPMERLQQYVVSSFPLQWLSPLLTPTTCFTDTQTHTQTQQTTHTQHRRTTHTHTHRQTDRHSADTHTHTHTQTHTLKKCTTFNFRHVE